MLVPYEKTSDYFFSGHTGAVLLFYMEIKRLKLNYKYLLFALSVIVYMMTILIVFRVHYVVDVIGGLVYAGFVYTVISDNLETVDRAFNWPY